MYKIAVVEDDIQLCDMIAGILEKYGYEIEKNFNFRNLSIDILSKNPHLLVLDELTKVKWVSKTASR